MWSVLWMTLLALCVITVNSNKAGIEVASIAGRGIECCKTASDRETRAAFSQRKVCVCFCWVKRRQSVGGHKGFFFVCFFGNRFQKLFDFLSDWIILACVWIRKAFTVAVLLEMKWMRKWKDRKVAQMGSQHLPEPFFLSYFYLYSLSMCQFFKSSGLLSRQKLCICIAKHLLS